MKNPIRVRFAPSPTGPLHIGGVRTALFNYLFAKKHKGSFILRIEDTDQNRYVSGAEDYIINALNWCNIPFSEGPGKEGNCGPYRQSERKKMYQQYAEQLISKGKAYYAFDTNDELNFHRKDHEKKGKTFIYNWHNREKLTNSISLTKEEVKKKIANGEDYVVRFKMYDPNQNMEEEVVAIAAPLIVNPSAANDMDEILKMPLLHLQTRPAAWSRWFAQQDLDVKNLTGIQFDQFATMIQAVVSVLGAAIVPKYLVENELKQGRLVGLGGSATSVIGSYFLVWPERSAHHPPVMAFQKWMKSTVGENAII